MDFILNLPMDQGNNGLLVCIDNPSKFFYIIPILVKEGEFSAK